MRTFCLLFFVFSLKFLFCQNLVPNPGFEYFTTCPLGTAQINKAFPWFDPTGWTSDYYNSCWINGGDTVDIPRNFWGYQFAKTGDAYAGLAISLQEQYSVREYISAPLIDSLKTGKKYCVEFYVSLSDKSIYASNGMGAYFSNGPVVSDSMILLFDPQIEELQIIKDTANWVLISGFFISTGGEKYITIGSFRTNDSTEIDSTSWGNMYYAGYYYIDDVSVTLCDTTTVVEIRKKNEEIRIYPNPAGNLVSISANCEGVIIITDIAGRKIKTIENFKNTIEFSLEEIEGGVYFVLLYQKGHLVGKQKLMVVK